ncbi:MAG TPA: C1 family peptidase [Thermoanaerobaculia bacterium]
MPEPTTAPARGRTLLPVLTRRVDLRPEIAALGLTVKSQGARGTCSVFASTFLIEYMTCREKKTSHLDYAEEYLNAVTNLAAFNNTPGDGDFFHAIAEGYRQFGIVPEAALPYQAAFNPELKPDEKLLAAGKAARFLAGFTTVGAHSPRGLDDDQLAAVLQQLDDGVPVAMGFHGSNTIVTTTFGRIVALDGMKNENSGAFAHSVPIVGYVARLGLPGGGGYFIYRDSGGPGAGDHGYGYFTFNYARKYVYDFVVYRRKPELLPNLIARPMTKVPPVRFTNREDLTLLARKINPRSRVI